MVRAMGRAREIYFATRKLPDLAWNRFVARPVAAVVVAVVDGTRITPNQITLLSLLVAAVAAAILIACPGYWGLISAILVYEFSYVLDCADGMLARLRSVQSKVGHLLDFLMDEVKAFMVLAAVSIRLFLASRDATWLILGLAGLVALASGVALTTFLRRPELAEPKRSLSESTPSPLKRVIGLVESLAKLLVHYPSYIWLAAVFGRIDLYFYPYIAVNMLYATKTMLGVVVKFGRSGWAAPGEG